MRPNDNGFDDQVESRILTAVKDTEGLHGFACHCHYYLLAWLPIMMMITGRARRCVGCGESLQQRARQSQRWGVQDIIDDDSWYDYIKLFAKFVSDIGYKGL